MMNPAAETGLAAAGSARIARLRSMHAPSGLIRPMQTGCSVRIASAASPLSGAAEQGKTVAGAVGL